MAAVPGNDLKPHIGIFGRMNVGKSSVINALTGRRQAIVSAVPGTTTDPVRKAMELGGLGPCVLIDTAGTDDLTELGLQRVDKSLEVLSEIDLALLLFCDNAFGPAELSLLERCQKLGIPCLLLHNKSDLQALNAAVLPAVGADIPVLEFSAMSPDNYLPALLKTIRKLLPETVMQPASLFKGIVGSGDLVVLVTPIDQGAPKGRMILPQVMAIRDLLDNDAFCVVLKETQLEDYLNSGGLMPALVITDSQAFDKVNKIVPPAIPLSSFSIAFARLRGPFEAYIKGTPCLDKLRDGDRVLIQEACTHLPSCEDIGRVKLPAWIRRYTGKQLEIELRPANDKALYPIASYAMVIQCGACMITPRQLRARLAEATAAGVPLSNYGLAIAWMNGIFDRVG
ncbi:MAG: [FeFe] hydrogenase H-cluster maturation GTPase HydF, partial [Bacteroidales bacterium]|nr:[FeFe] hydrogenase H-cluster maturation GTPase HydF [Bacteroidales bacterium]